MDEGFRMKPRSGGYVGGGAKCGRWNPTAEQVKVLTDLFRSGLRTPSTDQIQKISSQLSVYGKIESKNVFYWFQNHKARERQKRRTVSVDDQQKENHYEERNTSSRNFGELNRNGVSEPQRVIETLQLFPLTSFGESDAAEKLRFFANDCKGNAAAAASFSYTIGVDHMVHVDHHHHHPTLDLRLSFMS